MPNLNKFFYDLSYRFGTPRWDSGAVPPELIALVASNHHDDQQRTRTSLDLGCGTGTNAIYLAQNGYRVVGVDFTTQAIDQARAKAQSAGVSVDFRVSDVTHLEFLSEPFDVMLDVGCFHGLDTAGRARYVKHLARLSHPGSVLLMWGFDQPTFFGTYGIMPEQVRKQFAPYFALDRVEQGANSSKREGAWHWLVRQNEL